MSELKVINKNNQLLVESRDVAELIGKEHSHLMRDIRGYTEVLNKSENPKLDSQDFFIESTYQGERRKEKCFLLTRKGCDMVANKMTGEKGILFTATYVSKFEEMEESLNKPTCIEDVLITSLQEMKMIKQQLNQVNNNALRANKIATEAQEEVKSIKEVVSLDTTSWRRDTQNLINKIAINQGGCDHINLLRKESYDLLNKRFGVKLDTRLTNKRRRMAEEGISKSKRDKLNYLDVISEDKKLIEGYVAIVKDMAIKYGISNN